MFDFGVATSERVAVFIDGSSFYSRSRNLCFDVDYKRLRDAIRAQCGSVSSFNYVTLMPSDTTEYSVLVPLARFLSTNGYRVHEKLMVNGTDSDGMTKRNSLSGLMSALIQYVPSGVDHVLIFSDDEELAPALTILRQNTQVRVTLVAPMSCVYYDMKAAVDHIVDYGEKHNLSAFVETIGRQPRDSAPPQTVLQTPHEPFKRYGAIPTDHQPITSDDDHDPLIDPGISPVRPNLSVLSEAKMAPSVIIKRGPGRPPSAATLAKRAAEANRAQN